MELQVVAICRGCFEVYASSRNCPHCTGEGEVDGAALVPPPAVGSMPPAWGADGPEFAELDEALELAHQLDEPRSTGPWLAAVAVVGITVLLVMAAASVV